MAIEEHVNAIADLMAEVEGLADGPIKAKLAAVAEHIEAIHADPEAANVGLLISKSLWLRAKSIASNLRTDLYTLHSDMTEAAKVRGIDLPSIMGGGR